MLLKRNSIILIISSIEIDDLRLTSRGFESIRLYLIVNVAELAFIIAIIFERQGLFCNTIIKQVMQTYNTVAINNVLALIAGL